MRLLSRIGARPLVRAFKLTHMFTCATLRVESHTFGPNAVERDAFTRSSVCTCVYVCVRVHVRAVEYKVTAGAEAAATTSTHAMVETRVGWQKEEKTRRRDEEVGGGGRGERGGPGDDDAVFLSHQHATHT